MICDYLSIPRPKFLTDQFSGFRQCRARFPSTQILLEEVVHAILSPSGTDYADVVNGCARLVEQKLFEKIYCGDIHLGDGDAKFADPAADADKQRHYFANLKPTRRRRLEMDEGLTLEELGRRAVGSDTIRLPPSANGIPLGVARKPMIQDHDLNKDTGYATEDEIGLEAMVLADTGKWLVKRGPDNGFAIQHTKELRGSSAALQHVAREPNGGPPSNQLLPLSRNVYHNGGYANRRLAEGSTQPDGKDHLLPAGEHPYVSLPPFLDTLNRRSHVKPGRVQPQSGSDQDDDEEVVFLGERTVVRGLPC